jgi:hypothetical protein
MGALIFSFIKYLFHIQYISCIEGVIGDVVIHKTGTVPIIQVHSFESIHFFHLQAGVECLLLSGQQLGTSATTG